MEEKSVSNYGTILLIAAEVAFIGFLDYAVASYLPIEMGHYISLNVLYCLPIIQTARLTAVQAIRRYDSHTSTFIGIAVALFWSGTEVVIAWPYFPRTAFILNTFTRSVVFTVIGRVLVKLWRERKYAHIDALTGLANRLELMERLRSEQGRSERTRRPYSLLFMDIDEFKTMNDMYGHQGGDEALKLLADILRRSCRRVDIPARLGGDEFVLLLPDTDERSCEVVIKRIADATAREFQGRSWPISVSIGRTTNMGKTMEVEAVIQLADENMYQAKRMKQRAAQGPDGP
ncbi:MAG: GGDEF domain-containing protein [Gallionella sp.]